MQRFLNNPDDIVDETVAGFVRAHRDLVRLDPANPRVVVSTAAPREGRVAIVTGGGSGHEPAFIGYTGRNLVDAVAVGELFSSPTAKSFADAIRAADGGAGVAVLYGNYAGDNMNVRMAIEMVAPEGIEVATVVANDDVCSAPLSERGRRRGVAGEIFMWKIGGAAAAGGAPLGEVIRLSQKAIDACRSVGVGLGPCTLPAVGHPNFQIAPGTMEVGIGHHGEPGVRVEPLKSANDVADDMLDIVLKDHGLVEGAEVSVLLSGLGATPVNELYVLYDRIESQLDARGIHVHKAFVGNYFTSLEMVGATLTIMALDPELRALLDLAAEAPGLSTGTGTLAPVSEPARGRPAARLGAEAGPAPSASPAALREITLSGPSVAVAGNGPIVQELAAVIVSNKAHLSEIDGLIGDGDHGINMAKGFGRAAGRISENDPLDGAFAQLSEVLMSEIGGSMGPLYGHMFAAMARETAGRSALDADGFEAVLAAGLAAVSRTGNAKPGDKTLIDCLDPAVRAFAEAKAGGFAGALAAMSLAAGEGRDATTGLVAKIGRASRLGERSRGVPDAGATSCCLILQTLATALQKRLGEGACPQEELR